MINMLNYFGKMQRIARRCSKIAEKELAPASLRPFYSRRMPDPKARLFDCTITCIDFETTGLDFDKDTVISMGGVSIIDGSINFETAFHRFIKTEGKIAGETAVINQITPEQLENQGMDLKEAMMDLMDRLSGSIVLTHCSVIESTFIKRSLNLPDTFTLPMYFLDTMQIEKTLLKQPSPKADDVRLAEIRKRRNLPAYEAHNALADSLATAEVFLAQVKDIFGKATPMLDTIYKRSY